MNLFTWIEVCSVSKLKREKRFLIRHQQKQILLLWLDERIYAIYNQCPHQGFPLDTGMIDAESLNITCPYHHWRFNLKTGHCLDNSALLTTYPSEERDGQIWIQIPC
ncbi:MAG: Rieske (2Fe-2S) protein [Candidatus Sericytochromatia bacterium]